MKTSLRAASHHTALRGLLLASLATACSSDPAPADSGLSAADAGGTGDAAPADVADSGMADIGALDVGNADAGVPDTGARDAGVPDSGMVDGGTPDTGVLDSGVVDTGTPDTGLLDSGAADTGTPDTGTPDTGTPDTGAPDVPVDVPAPGTPYVAALSGAEAVPLADGVTSTGTATFSLVGTSLSYTISHDVPSPTAVVLARGDAGEAGTTVNLLAAASGSVPLSAADLTALAEGRLYVAVNTAAATGGYIRGQILPPDRRLYAARVSRFESFPRSPSATVGTASFVPIPDTGMLRYHVHLSSGTATALAVSSAPPGFSNAGLALTLDASGTHADGVVYLGVSTLNFIEVNRLRLHVTSADGTLVVPILRPGGTYFGGNADGTEMIPMVSTGSTVGAHFVLDYAGTSLWYDVATALPATAMAIYNGPGGVVGTRVFSLPGVQGTRTLTADDATALRARALHLRLDSASRPGGELRLQIRRPGENLFSAVLSNAGTSPASTSTATGGVQFVLSADGATIYYRGSVTGLAGALSAVELRAVGGTTALVTLSSFDTAPAGSALLHGEITGANVATVLPLLQGATAAVLVRTASFAGGEVRGVPALRGRQL